MISSRLFSSLYEINIRLRSHAIRRRVKIDFTTFGRPGCGRVWVIHSTPWAANWGGVMYNRGIGGTISSLRSLTWQQIRSSYSLPLELIVECRSLRTRKDLARQGSMETPKRFEFVSWFEWLQALTSIEDYRLRTLHPCSRKQLCPQDLADWWPRSSAYHFSEQSLSVNSTYTAYIYRLLQAWSRRALSQRPWNILYT